MKIAFVLAHPYGGIGSEVRELRAAERFKSLGHDVILYRSYYEDSGIKMSHPLCAFFPVDKALSPVPARHSQSTLLVNSLAGFKPNVIFVKGTDYRLIADCVLACEDTCRVCCIAGGSTVWHADERLPDLVLTESETARVTGKINAFPESIRQIVLPKYIDWDLVEGTRHSGFHYDMCNIGAFVARKNQEMLLPLGRSYHVAMAGAGPRLDAIKSLSCDLPRVKILGHLDKQGVYSLLSSSKVLAHCSFFEGFPRAAAESLALGTPVVAIQSAVREANVYPFLRSVTFESYYRELISILDMSESSYNELRRGCFEYAKTHYSAERLMSVFDEALISSV